MRQGPNSRRSRGRNNNNNNNNNTNGNNPGRRQNVPLRHQTFDSNGPDVRIRGNAFQIYEKYQALARDAQSSGDRVAAENFLQHAEHYYRIIGQITEQEQRQRDGGHHRGGNGQSHMNGGPADADDDGDDDSEAADDDRESVTV